MGKRIIYLLVAICIVNVVYGWVSMVEAHETAHRQMFLYCGINATIHYRLFGLLGGYTMPERYNSTACPVAVLNGLNEAVGYPFDREYMVFSSFFLIIIILIGAMMFRIEQLEVRV